MGELNLVQLAREVLCIHEDLPMRVKHRDYRVENKFELVYFSQVWGNTSGGFEGWGGSAMTTMNTFVLVPLPDVDEDCIVYFSGTFAYSVPYSDEFMKDVRDGNVAGKQSYRKYLKA